MSCGRGLFYRWVGVGYGLGRICCDFWWWTGRGADGEGGGCAGDAVEGGEDAGDEGGIGEVGAEDEDLVGGEKGVLGE